MIDGVTDFLIQHNVPAVWVAMKLFWAGLTATTLVIILRKISRLP